MKNLIILILLSISFNCFSQSLYEQNQKTEVKPIFLKCEKPLNKIDSINIDLQYTKTCLISFKREQLSSVGLGFVGALGGGIGIGIKNDAVSIGGGVIALIGMIVYLDSFKFLRMAGKNPILEPYENGVCIRI